jgi:hypothetical protein
MKILDRDNKGVTTIQDESGVFKITIPKCHSALSLLSSCEKNNWQDKEVIADDGYVYDKAGNRKRKWFSDLRVASSGFVRCGDRRIGTRKPFYYWHPKLENLAYCEAKYYKMCIKVEQFFKNSDVFKKTIAAQPFLCAYEKSYVVFDGKPTDQGLGWNWCKEEDIKNYPFYPYPMNQEAGDAYFAYREEADRWYRRKWYFEKLFLKSLDKNLSLKLTGLVDYVKLSVNNREYLITKDLGYDSEGVKILCNPKNTVIIEIG